MNSIINVIHFLFSSPEWLCLALSAPIIGAFKFRTVQATFGGPDSSQLGTQIGSRVSSTDISLYYNGVSAGTTATADSGTVPTIKFASGAIATSNTTAVNFGGLTSQLETFGGGLTAAEVLILHDASIAYNRTGLSR